MIGLYFSADRPIQVPERDARSDLLSSARDGQAPRERRIRACCWDDWVVHPYFPWLSSHCQRDLQGYEVIRFSALIALVL